MNIKKLSQDKYRVESESSKGTFYAVEPDKPFCDCPGYIYRMRPQGKLCKHIRAVKEYLEKRETVVSNKNKEKLDDVIAFVTMNQPVDSVKLLGIYGEELINDMIEKGFLIEQDGMIMLLE